MQCMESLRFIIQDNKLMQHRESGECNAIISKHDADKMIHKVNEILSEYPDRYEGYSKKIQNQIEELHVQQTKQLKAISKRFHDKAIKLCQKCMQYDDKLNPQKLKDIVSCFISESNHLIETYVSNKDIIMQEKERIIESSKKFYEDRMKKFEDEHLRNLELKVPMQLILKHGIFDVNIYRLDVIDGTITVDNDYSLPINSVCISEKKKEDNEGFIDKLFGGY